MSDAPTPDEVQARLRRALSTRSGDMAAGDGTPWEPGRSRPGILPFAPAESPRRGPSWRTLVAAVAALAVPVAGGAVLLNNNDGEHSTPPAAPSCVPLNTATTEPGTFGRTTEPPWTSDPPSTTISVPATDGSPVTTAPFAPDGEPTTTEPWTDPPTTEGADPGAGATTSTEPCEPTSDDTEALQEDCDAVLQGNGDTVGFLAESSDDQGRPYQFSVAVNSYDPAVGEYPGSEPIQAGEHQGTFATIEGGDGWLSAITVRFGDVEVVVEGRGLTKDQLVELTATVRQDSPDTFMFTPLAGFNSLCGPPTTTPPTPNG